MLAMHYEFALPADYDMRRIRDRVAERGHMFDSVEGMVFKAFLLSDITAGGTANRYAPVYLWSSAAAAWTFVGGPLFAALSKNFGRPRVQTGFVLGVPNSGALANAEGFTRQVETPVLSADQPLTAQGLAPSEDGLSWLDSGDWRRTSLRTAAENFDRSGSGAMEIVYLARGADWSALA